jgi:hypothetical protein
MVSVVQSDEGIFVTELIKYRYSETVRQPTERFGPLARADRLEIFTLNPKNWVSFAVGLGFGLKGLIATIDKELCC